jgi:[CysO sulfur-carrier protein]-S-L-cysteine hydrolase
MIERLRVSTEHWEQMRAHVQACEPMEGCGLLAGKGVAVERVYPIGNAAQSPNRFRMDPVEQLRAFQQLEDQSLELVGVFHSHPAAGRDGTTRLAEPSETDVREAAYPVVHVIWSQGSGLWQARGFWIAENGFNEVPLVVSPTE